MAAKGNLRYANSIARRRTRHIANFARWGLKLLEELDNGQLRAAANRAANTFGHGRIRDSDGRFTDIGQNLGGITRTILDDYVPIEIPSSESEPGGPSPTGPPIPSPASDNDASELAVLVL